MKYYKKFYEVENNRYYTLEADDELYIATESFLKIGKSRILRKDKELVQGLKLLKMSTPIATLFNFISCMEPNKGDKNDDLATYDKISNKDLKNSIRSYYDIVFDQQLMDLKEWYDGVLDKVIDVDKFDKTKFVEKYNELKNQINRNNPTKNGSIGLDNVDYTENTIIRSMVRNGLDHLYTEKVTNFCKNVFLYEFDMFGTLTIYVITTVKGVTKGMSSFIYDKKLIDELMKFIYEEDNKKEGK